MANILSASTQKLYQPSDVNLSKFATSEKIHQFIEGRKRLNESAFRPVFYLLKKVRKMDTYRVTGLNRINGDIPYISDMPPTNESVYYFNKLTADPIKKDTSAILNKLELIEANQHRVDPRDDEITALKEIIKKRSKD